MVGGINLLKPIKLRFFDKQKQEEIVLDSTGREISFMGHRLFVHEVFPFTVVTDAETGHKIAQDTDDFVAISVALERIVKNGDMYIENKKKIIEKYGVLNP